MGFLFASNKQAPAAKKKHIPIETMKQMGCAACPLDKVKIKSPKMKPTGAKNPLIYLLGDVPDQYSDKKDDPLAGDPGDYLYSLFPERMIRNDIRAWNVVRCHNPDNDKDPDVREMECCRGYIEADIEASKPLVVVALGHVAMNWVSKFGAMTVMSGRMIACKIGTHSFWLYPIFHPNHVLKKRGKYGKSELELTFEHYIKSLIKKLDGLEPPRVFDSNYDDGLKLITGHDGARDFALLEDEMNWLARQPSTAIDIETNSLRPYIRDPHIWTCSVATFNRGVAFCMDHPDGWNSSYMRKVWGLLGDYLLESRRKVAHHLGMELEWLSFFYGRSIGYRTQWADTMGQAHTLDERKGALSLDMLCRMNFGFFLKDQSRVDPVRLLEFPVKEALRYNGMDSKWTHLLDQYHDIQITENDDYIWETNRKADLERALVATQLKGVATDIQWARDMQTEARKELSSIERKIMLCQEVQKFKARFGLFSPTAPENVLKMLRDVCHREEIKTEDGFTTGEEVLQLIPADEVPSVPLILEHRMMSKLLGTYIEPLASRKIVSHDGYIHCKYNSMVAETGRLSSEDPNMQNFPKRKNAKVRGTIVAPDGYDLVPIDYGQIEARVIGMASEDQNLMRAIWTDYDIHGFWAGRVLDDYHPRTKDRIIKQYKIDGDDDKLIRKTLRNEMKNGWVFPQFFGSAVKSCAANLMLPVDVAEQMGREFWDEFPGVLDWQKKLMRFYEKYNYVATLTGRRRRGVLSKNQIINVPVQGTAADIVTAAYEYLAALAAIEEDENFCPDINVHDDLTFRLPTDRRDYYLDIITREMVRPRFDFITAPLLVEVSVGKRWHDVKEIQKVRSDVVFNLRNPYK